MSAHKLYAMPFLIFVLLNFKVTDIKNTSPICIMYFTPEKI